MRILEICPYDLARPGGVQRQVQLLAGALEDLGDEVTVLGPGPGRARAEQGDPRQRLRRLHCQRPSHGRYARRRARLGGGCPPPRTAGAARWSAHAGARAPCARTGGRHRASHGSFDPAAYPAPRPWRRRRAAAGGHERRVAGGGRSCPALGAARAEDRPQRCGGAPGDPRERDWSRVLFVGRLEEREGLGVLLALLEGLAGCASEVVIVGNGPLAGAVRSAQARWRTLVRWGGSLDDYIFQRLAIDYLPREVREDLGVLTTAERRSELLFPAEEITEPTTRAIAQTYAEAEHPIEEHLPRHDEHASMAASDAPYCFSCGNVMQRSGACYVCPACGTTSGCS